MRFLARKAKKLARKWGGQCIVFIDEIDAVGMRRQALQGRLYDDTARHRRPSYYGRVRRDQLERRPHSSRARAWREHMFELRAPERRSPYPAGRNKIGNIVNQGIFPGMMGGGQGQLALNQLLVTMDGIDNPPFLRRF